MALDFDEENWELVTSFARAGKCVFPCQLKAKIIKIFALAEDARLTWRRAGRISRFLDLDQTQVESQILILNQPAVIVWRDDLVNFYRLSFYPVPWLESFVIQFVIYRFTGE